MDRLRASTVTAGAAIALGAQLAPLDDRFWAHMVQHLLIGDLGPLLVAWGWRPNARLLAVPAWAALLVGWHVTPLYDAALHHWELHLLQHASFFAAGVGIWSVLFGTRLATSWKLATVVAMWLVSLGLSQVFMWSGHSYYAAYSISDQRAGGGVMLVEGSFVMIGVVVWLLLRLFEETEVRQRALDG